MTRKFAVMFLIISAMMMSMYAAGRTPPTEPPVEHELIEAANAMRRSGLVQFNLKDMDVERFLLFMSELLKENVIIQPGLNQKVTIISSRPVTMEEARRMMITALEVVGLTMERTNECLVVKRSPSWAQVPSKSAPPKKQPIVSRDIEIYDDVPLEVIEGFISRPFEEISRMRTRYNKGKGGHEVQWIQNASLFRKLGVKRGDIIKSVNGIDIIDITLNDIDAIIHTIMERNSFDITVLRDGETKLLNHAVRQTSPDVKPEPEA